MSAPARTVTLSEIKSPTTTPKTISDVHLYTQLITQDNDVKGYFDTGLFYNTEEFTIMSSTNCSCKACQLTMRIPLSTEPG
jgi:hypothetical protein